MESSNTLLLAHIRNGLSDLVMLLRGMSPGQIQGLSQFVNPSGWVDMNLAMLDSWIRQSNDQALLSQLELGNRFLDGLVKQNTTPPEEKQQQDLLQFVQLYHLWCLQQMLREVSFEQLLKLFDILASKTQMEQLHLLDDFKTLLGQLDKETLHSLHSEISEISREQPGTEASRLPELIQFEHQHFHLYDPLRQLLQLSLDQFLSLSDILPQWGMVQLLLLTRLRESGAFDVSDYTALLVPEKIPREDVAMVSPVMPSILAPPTPPQPALMLTILEQPPLKCVYKRNVKPAPTVVIEGDQSANDGNLYIVPLLIRCDTLEEEPKLLTGNAPQKITATRTVAFKSLKILTTSHKMNETLFSFQFELRRYNGNSFEVVHRVVSNPILVLSHSTQLKATPKLLPMVTEVIPFGGPDCGGTRVAILGSGFCDSPTVRVKFDQIEVMPIFHGAKTLIVSTPQHEPGTVEVRVCNDMNSWSESTATFTYHGTTNNTTQQLTSAAGFGFHSNLDPQFFGNNSPNFMSTGMNNMNNFMGPPSGLDSSGFNSLHYAASAGDLYQTGSLLSKGANPNVQDKQGNSALHWAAIKSHYSIVLLLLSVHSFRHQTLPCRLQPCQVDLVNDDGETALHWAAREGNWNIAEPLVKRGANINIQNRLGLSPLHVACAAGHLFFVHMLLSYGALMSVTTEGFLPLHLACLGGHSEVVNEVLMYDNRATINAADYEGNTPLHCAIVSGDMETVKMLLEAPTRPPSPIDFLTRGKFTSTQVEEQKTLRSLLLELEKIHDKVDTAQFQKHPSLQQGQSAMQDMAIVDVENADGETPLLLAFALASFEIAKLLINYGASVNKCDHMKITPAHCAVLSEDIEMVSYLLVRGSDFHIPNSNGDSAYSMSLRLQNKAVAWMIPSKKRSREAEDPEILEDASQSQTQRPSKRSKQTPTNQIWKPSSQSYPLLSRNVSFGTSNHYNTLISVV